MFPKRGVVSGALCLLMLGASALPTWADQLGDAVQQQQSLSNQTNQARNKLKDLTYVEDEIKAELVDLENRLAAAQTQLNQRHAAFVQAQEQVAAAQNELELKQKELEDRQEAMGKRAKAIYESGQMSYFEMLFQATSLGDFITRMEYFSMLLENDRKLLQDIQIQKEQINQKMIELQKKRDQAVQLEAQAAAAKKELDQVKTQQQIALEKNLKEQHLAIEYIERLEAEANTWNEKIRQLQAARVGGVSGSISAWPLEGNYRISSPYGWRTHPVTQKQSLHTGVDIPASSGTSIAAAGDGVVIVAGWNDAYGNMIIIDHGQGLSTLYGHQSALNVTEGQEVKAGQVIGYVGSTGWSTGPHLHFEIRENGNSTDPLRYYN